MIYDVQKFLGYLNLNLGNKNEIIQVQITVAMKLDCHFFFISTVVQR
jgi:hypothetical protein